MCSSDLGQGQVDLLAHDARGEVDQDAAQVLDRAGPAQVGVADERYEMLEYIKKNFAFIGELSLSGKLVSVHGALALALGVRNAGVKNIVVPATNVDEVKVLMDINVYGFSHLNEVMDFIRGDLDAESEDRKVIKKRNTIKRSENFSQVYGQELVKRAITIAVAGHHGILMVGPPGVGKTMIANRIPSIMPI